MGRFRRVRPQGEAPAGQRRRVRLLGVLLALVLCSFFARPEQVLAAGVWAISTSPNTSSTQSNDLQAVSCTSASFCMAVGQYTGASANQTLVEQWNGTIWSIVTSPNAGTTLSNTLRSVTCTSASFCVAAGYHYLSGGYAQTLIEQWNGTSWSIVTSPDSSTTQNNFLQGVSCTSSTFCVVAGYYHTIPYDQTLIEQWNGTSWSIVTSPNTSTAQTNELNAVSCTGATFCVSAGHYTPAPSADQTLIEHWNGTTWTIVASANSSSTQGNYVSGVSCTSTSFCIGAGYYYNGTVDQTLIEKWNGTSWSIVASPNTSTTQPNDLYGVSCSGTAFCMAAGYAGNTPQTLVEQWDGTSWSIGTSPNTLNDYLHGAACPTTAFCMAAGYSQPGSSDRTLIEQYPAPPPAVTGISPTSGPTSGGTSVTITGSGFTGAAAVTFGTTAATSFTVNSDTQITAASPVVTAAGVVDVTVTASSGTSATGTADHFTYTATLSISPPAAVSLGTTIAAGSTVSAAPLGALGYTNTMNDGQAWNVTVAVTDLYNATGPKVVPFTNFSITTGQTVSPAGPTPTGAGPTTLSGTDTTPGTTYSNALTLVNGTATQNGTYSQSGDAITVIFPANVINSGTMTSTIQYTITG